MKLLLSSNSTAGSTVSMKFELRITEIFWTTRFFLDFGLKFFWRPKSKFRLQRYLRNPYFHRF